MAVLINLGNGWIVSTDEIRYIRPIKNSEHDNKSTVLLLDGERIHTSLTADEIEARIAAALIKQTRPSSEEVLPCPP